MKRRAGMEPKVTVFLDPDGTIGEYLAVLVRFEGGTLPPDRLARLREAVQAIPWWPQGGGEGMERVRLRLDDTRLSELLEGWVPVLMPDGEGVLVWPNCD